MRSEQELSHSLLNHFLSKYSISNQLLSVIVKLTYSGSVGGLALTLRQLFGPPLFQLASQPGPSHPLAGLGQLTEVAASP